MYLIEDGATGAVYENVSDYGREGDRVAFRAGNGLRASIPANRAIIIPARYASKAKDRVVAEKQEERAESPSPRPSSPKKRKGKAKGKPVPDYWPTAEDERRAKSRDLYRRNRGWD